MEEELPSWASPVSNEPTPTASGLPSWAKPVTEPTAETGLPSWAKPAQTTVVEEEEERTLPTSGYAPSELLEPERLAIIDRTLKSYYGTDSIDGYEPQERVDQFVNTFRYLGAGNTVKTVGFVDHILSTDQQGRQALLEGYELFDGLSGSWKDYTFQENFDRVRDYVVGAVVDPVNIVAPLVGKAVAQTGTTAASRLALEAARREASRLAAQGASDAVQLAAANVIKGKTLKEIAAKTGKRSAYKEVMGAMAFDTAVAAGTDVAYQHGLIQIGAKEEQDRFQTGLAALGGIVGGGIAAAGVAVKGSSQLGMANVDIPDFKVTNKDDLTGALSALADSLDAIPDNQFKEVFAKKVGRGKELEALDTEFWGRLILGDDELEFKGLAQIMYDKGFRYLGKRETGDNITNWLSDAMKNSPEPDILRFVDSFQKKTGIKLKGMETPSIDLLADNMSKKMSQSGWLLNRMSQVSKMMKFKNAKEVTMEDAAAYLFGDIMGTSLKRNVGDEIYHPKFGVGKITKLDEGKVSATFKSGTKSVREGSLTEPPGRLGAAFGKVGSFVDWAQSSYIRLLVTHPGTSALNIAGWSTKSVGQSASDLLRSTAIYGTTGTYKALTGRTAEASKDWGKLLGAYKANLRKISNLIDPDTTARAFDSLVDRNPEIFKDLVGVLPGGIVRPTAAVLGKADPEKPAYQQVGEGAIEGLQYIGLVKAQDVFTKSQEVMYNLDINLRETFGMGYRELMSRPDASVIFNSKQFNEAQTKAVGTTLDNILSKSYARHDNKAIARVAGFIEDFRTLPVIGATIPFGRFFNNVIATISEYSGANIPLKALGVAAQKQDWSETIAKPVVGWVAAVSILDKEIDLLERGIAWDESIDENTGQRFSERYDAPAIGTKALARWLAYKSTTGEVPEDFLKDASAAVVGQLTRQLSSTGDAFLESVSSVLQGDYDDAAVGLASSIGSLGGTLGSGLTRFAEPINAIVALGDTPQEYMAVDVKTGNPGFAKAFRYIDQLIGGAGMGDTLGATSPTAEFVGRTPARIAGQRPQAPTNSITRVFAMVGRPQWDADLFADDPIAQNIVTREFQPIVNSLAQTRLLNNKLFMDGDMKMKQSMLSDVLKTARELTHRGLQSSTNPDNPRLSALFKLTQQTRVQDLEKYMADIGLEAESIHELTTRELEILKFYVDNDDDLRRESALREMRNRQ